MSNYAVSELQFQVRELGVQEREVEYEIGVGTTSQNDHERRQAWRRAGFHRYMVGERGAMIAECIARWAGEP